MSIFTKDRVLRIVGLVFVCVGILFHSQAQKWALVPFPYPSLAGADSTGKPAMYADPYIFGLLSDAGMVMMILGGVTLILGLISWVYPPAEVRESA